MKKAGLPLGRPAFFIAEFSDLVHESPETLDFPLALHQVRGSIRRRLQKDLVHESPETIDFPLALHQVRGQIRRRLQKDLVHESPETLDFPLALHQVRGSIRRRLQKDLVHESPETLIFRWPCTKSEARFGTTRRPLGAIPQKPGAKPSEPASNVLP